MKVLDQQEGKGWAAYHGDCAEVLREMPEASVDFSVYSPPFASLYTYSASERDMGNCRNHAEFFEHFAFLMPEMLRVTKPGRLMSVHSMDLPTSKARDGEIGLADFPGDIVRAAQAAGWVWASKVTIRKDPVTAMQRTKALGLLWKTIQKDSAMSRMGIPDYVHTFRKPGVNEVPIAHSKDAFPVSQWQRWAEPVWTIEDSEADLRHLAAWAGLVWDDINPNQTLQHRSAREENDERHICPLQLEVIRRCITMWSNPGDVVLTPFGGIGSEAYVALEENRRAILVELKASYYAQAVANLRTVEPNARGKQLTMTDMIEGAA